MVDHPPPDLTGPATLRAPARSRDRSHAPSHPPSRPVDLPDPLSSPGDVDLHVSRMFEAMEAFERGGGLEALSQRRGRDSGRLMYVIESLATLRRKIDAELIRIGRPRG